MHASRRLPLLPILVVLGLTPAAASFATDLRGAIDRDYSSLEALYRRLHAHPEVSSHEVETAKLMAQQARDAGLTVTEGVGGTGVVAVLRNGAGPTVMIRTELDALPVEEATGLPFSAHGPVAHACGHDLHMTVWTGTARRLVAEKAHWSGTLVMIAQPAEESGGGLARPRDPGCGWSRRAATEYQGPDSPCRRHRRRAADAGVAQQQSL
jgi:hippurate hydrolase